jgi:hypothetical protein
MKFKTKKFEQGIELMMISLIYLIYGWKKEMM